MQIIIITIVVLLLSGVIEKVRHVSRLRRIPVRIHINGTRGKSLLTRMITDMFDRAGWKVVAKTTGEKPLIFITGKGWSLWRRFAPPRIKEQMRFVRRAITHQPRAIILENMALEPENQYVSEKYMMMSTLGIFTNFRPDHQEIMGGTKKDVERVLSYSLPENSKILIPQAELSSFREQQINSHKSQLIPVERHINKQSSFLSLFNDHFNILQQVKEEYGIPQYIFDKTVAEWQHALDPGNFLIKVSATQYLVNLFTCNDVTSASEMINCLEAGGIISPPYAVVLACRGDRPLRTKVFLEWILNHLNYSQLILTGTFPLLMVKKLFKKFDKSIKNSVMIRNIKPERIIQQFDNKAQYVLGLGNYNHSGEKIISYLVSISQ